MTEWPVKLISTTAEIPHELSKAIPPGETTYIKPSRRHKETGVTSYFFLCPRCGEAGVCNDGPFDGQPHWEVTIDEGRVTMHPSILCPCSGHYFLTDGVLREV